MFLSALSFEIAGWALVLVVFCGLFLAFEAAIYGRRLDRAGPRASRGSLFDVLRRSMGR